ncbi:glycosyltransferase family protein [Methanoplanus limicola]|uniref:Uncharacterized protein n=1 Tax=Methanoplanus limicola DSM 2279 TaxID=937775 RepID=H1YZR1_9EURY|nr:hypothetical protein [Methanoplanus limicola]EHQ34323.1 hypothetical protein Metlim_0170 [Methanoplanus limicola DSM 2279]
MKRADKLLFYIKSGINRFFPQQDKLSALLILFLIFVLTIAYFIPLLFFGRPFGTDTYTHLFHTMQIYNTDSLFSFYEEVGKIVFNPGLNENSYNYPFGSWLFIAVISKISGLKPILTAGIFSALYLAVIISTYYVYSGSFLMYKWQKILSILFLLSMPIAAISLETFRPSVFVIPFLLLAFYFAYSEKLSLKTVVIITLMSITIALSHAGTFIYLMIFSIVFFLAGCLFQGKFYKTVYFILASSFFVYWVTVRVFPHLLPQYANKSSMFMIPGNFMATKLHIFFADDLSYILYNNMFVNDEFVYALIYSALFFALGQFLIYVNKFFIQKYNEIKKSRNYALIPASISHSSLLIPFWIGPVHTILSFAGFFRLDSKGKCFMISLLAVTVLPAWINETEDIAGATGVLREINYLILIIPVSAVLGFSKITEILQQKKKGGRFLLLLLTLAIISSAIIIPLIGNAYYNNKFSGDDYIINGMTWLSGTGSPDEKVVGVGYRNIPIFTEKQDSTYGLMQGSRTKTFTKILNRVYFYGDGNHAMEHYTLFGTRYYLLSDKLISNLHGKPEDLTIDHNIDLDRIYSCRDFGIYSLSLQSGNTLMPNEGYHKNSGPTINEIGSGFEINTEAYKISVDKYNPTIKYIGDNYHNLLQEGSINEMASFYFYSTDEQFSPSQYSFNSGNNYEIKRDNNQLIYRTIIKNKDRINISTAEVRYTFYPEIIKREYIISNDRIENEERVPMLLYFNSEFFSPSNNFFYFNNNERYEKTIYPSQDCVELDDKFERIYISEGDSGIFIDYEDTSVYPDYLYYKGIISCEYSVIGLRQYEIVEPGASVHITQYISAGAETTAERRINEQNRVSLHLYPDGILPLIFCSYNSGTVLAGPGEFREISTKNSSIKLTETLGRTQKEINLKSLKQYSVENTPYITSIMINVPYYNLINNEGLRHPQNVLIDGEETDIIILPISKPATNILSFTNNSEKFFEDWEKVAESASENNDMALFLITESDISNQMKSGKMDEFLNYAEILGLFPVSADETARHFRLIGNIEYNFAEENDKITITARNKNNEAVKGLTFRIKMPAVKDGSYIAQNSKIVKEQISGDQKIIFVSVNLEPGESKKISILPDFERKKLLAEISGCLGEGEAKIKITDDKGEEIDKATVIIDSEIYYTDENGIIEVFLRRGEHKIIVKKAGYTMYSYEFVVTDRISAILGIV